LSVSIDSAWDHSENGEFWPLMSGDFPLIDRIC
jgi:hypothetical protein